MLDNYRTSLHLRYYQIYYFDSGSMRKWSLQSLANFGLTFHGGWYSSARCAYNVEESNSPCEIRTWVNQFPKLRSQHWAILSEMSFNRTLHYLIAEDWSVSYLLSPSMIIELCWSGYNVAASLSLGVYSYLSMRPFLSSPLWSTNKLVSKFQLIWIGYDKQ